MAVTIRLKKGRANYDDPPNTGRELYRNRLVSISHCQSISMPLLCHAGLSGSQPLRRISLDLAQGNCLHACCLPRPAPRVCRLFVERLLGDWRADAVGALAVVPTSSLSKR